MSRCFLGLLSLLFVGLAACGSDATKPIANVSSSPSPSAVVSPTAGSACADDPRAHVYSPDRLQLIAACVVVTGTIESEEAEADGDYHVRLRLDPGQTCGGQQCLNAANVSGQAGDLLLEPVCIRPVAQADAVSACEGYQNPLVLPPVGSHVKVIGPFVLDTDHGWNEIHPLESVIVLATPSPVASPSSSPTTVPTPTTAPTPLFVKITASTYGSVAATTLAGASCNAKAKLPSGRISTAADLTVTVVAGDDGDVSWSYRTVSNTTKGTGTHTVTCTLAGKTVSASAPFSV